MTGAQQRVHALITERGTPVTSKEVAAELGISVNWASCCLAALVNAGVLDVRNADGGTYKWMER
jgi:DNA-binding IscR family transcriptional regulator